MSDLISRKALIESVKTWDMQDLYLPTHFIDLIEDEPSVTDTNVGGKWVPCSEKMPNEYDYPEQRYRILASCSDGIVRNATIKTMLNGEKHYATGHVEFVYEAWMPLPEPYKGE